MFETIIFCVFYIAISIGGLISFIFNHKKYWDLAAFFLGALSAWPYILKIVEYFQNK